jgi:hypothetical protein
MYVPSVVSPAVSMARGDSSSIAASALPTRTALLTTVVADNGLVNTVGLESAVGPFGTVWSPIYIYNVHMIPYDQAVHHSIIYGRQ